MKRRIVVILAIVGLFLAVVSTRVFYSSRKEYFSGRKALAAGRTEPAVLHFRRSAHWYAPGNPYVVSSLDALWHIGRSAEASGRIDLALMAYRAIRSSVLGTRSFYTPHAAYLHRVNPKIAVLMAQQQIAYEKQKAHPSKKTGPASTSTGPVNGTAMAPSKGTPHRGAQSPDQTQDPGGRIASAAAAPGNAGANAAPAVQNQTDLARYEKLRAFHLALLERTNAPSVLWSLLAIIGLLVWVSSGFGLAYKAFTSDDHIIIKNALWWGGGIAAGLILWLVSLSLA
ncbi:MAG: hypothetical protein J7M25_13910 [Deltaproteobacteria bacterium]|nr:hypothetical protein [Deltaproteobacteria bacterium]